MKKILVFLTCALLVMGLAGCSGSQPSYYGVWSIDSLLADAPMGDFSPEDLETMLKTSLTFSKTEASCFGDQMDSLGQTVSQPDYVEMDIPQDSFESMTGITFEILGYSKNSISQVSVVNDPSYNNGIVFYVLDDQTLLANSLGTFFVLKKAE